MIDRDAVLFANAAFYAAFFNRDFKAMEGVWAKEHAISCTHPGWTTLHGRELVMESWSGILGNANAPKIKCRNEHAEVYGDFAIVTCVEDLGEQQYLVATNIFVRAGHIWSMVHHHAGPTNVDPESVLEDEDEASGLVN